MKTLALLLMIVATTFAKSNKESESACYEKADEIATSFYPDYARQGGSESFGGEYSQIMRENYLLIESYSKNTGHACTHLKLFEKKVNSYMNTHAKDSEVSMVEVEDE